jgi:hypothetical protein
MWMTGRGGQWALVAKLAYYYDSREDMHVMFDAPPNLQLF